MDGRPPSIFIQVLKPPPIILLEEEDDGRRFQDLLPKVLPEPLSRPSSSFVPSSSDLVVSHPSFLLPVRLLPPLLTRATFGQTLRYRACGGVFLAVLAKTAKST